MKGNSNENIKSVHSILSKSSTSATEAGAGVDCQGFREAMVDVNAGAATGAASTAIKVQESSDDGVLDAYTDITGAAFTAITSSNDNTGYQGRINLEKRKRYLRAYGVGDGANAQVYGVKIVLSQPVTPPSTPVNASAFSV